MLVIDVSNVLGSRPDGWWRDRAAATEALVARIRAQHPGAVCVLDPGADDEVVRVVAAAGGACTVVTSDRELAARVRALGAQVRGAGAFRRELDDRAES